MLEKYEILIFFIYLFFLSIPQILLINNVDLKLGFKAHKITVYSTTPGGTEPNIIAEKPFTPCPQTRSNNITANTNIKPGDLLIFDVEYNESGGCDESYSNKSICLSITVDFNENAANVEYEPNITSLNPVFNIYMASSEKNMYCKNIEYNYEIHRIVYRIPYQFSECNANYNMTYINDDETFTFNLFNNELFKPLISSSLPTYLHYKFSIKYKTDQSTNAYLTRKGYNSHIQMNTEILNSNNLDYIFHPQKDKYGNYSIFFTVISPSEDVCSNVINLIVCYLNCKKCSQEGNEEYHNCDECRDGYANYFSGIANNCYNIEEFKRNNRTYLNPHDNILYDCYENCETCDELGNNEDNKCKSCIENTYKTEYPVNQNCYNLSDKRIKTKYFLKGHLFINCYKTCYTCSKEGNEAVNNCDTCDNKTYFKLDNHTGMCYDEETIKKHCFNCFKKDMGNSETLNKLTGYVYYRCYHLCAECEEKGDDDDMKCSSCIDSYYFDYQLIHKNNIHKCVTDHGCDNLSIDGCGVCGVIGLLKGCITCKYNKGYYPIQIISDSTDFVECINIANIPENYIFIEEKKVFVTCSDGCIKCVYLNKTNIENEVRCIKCGKGYALIEERGNQCMSECPFNYYFDRYGRYRCTQSFICESEAPLLIKEKKKCTDNCTLDSIYNRTFAGECVKECPEGSDEVANGFCIWREANNDLNCGIRRFYTNYTKDELNEDIYKKYMLNYINSFKNISSYVIRYDSLDEENSYTILIYKKEKCVREMVKDHRIIGLEECINILTEQIPLSSQPLVFVIYSTLKKPETVTYYLYTYTNNPNQDTLNVTEDPSNYQDFVELSLSPCESLNYSYFINAFEVFGMDNELLKRMAPFNTSILNLEDTFFHDICFHYREDGIDYTLEERKEKFYKNLTLCDQGCNYKRINLETFLYECECKVKKDNNSKEIIEKEKTEEFISGLKDTNFAVLKCYKDIYKWDEFKRNIGGLFILTSFSIQIICFLFIPRHIKVVRRAIFEQFIKNNPPIKKNKKYNIDDILNDNNDELNNIDDNKDNDIIDDKDKDLKSNKIHKNNGNSEKNDSKDLELDDNYKYNLDFLKNMEIIDDGNNSRRGLIKISYQLNKNGEKQIINDSKQKNDVHLSDFGTEKNIDKDNSNNNTKTLKNPIKKDKYESLMKNKIKNEKIKDNVKLAIIDNDVKPSAISNFISSIQKIQRKFYEKNVKEQMVKDINDKKINKSNLEKSIVRPINVNSKRNNDYDEMDFNTACSYDRRSLCEMTIETVKSRQVIVNTFFVNEKLKPFSLKLSVFLFTTCLYFTVNAILFNDEYIQEKNKNNIKKNFIDEILELVKGSSTRIFYSSCVGTVVNIVINLILSSDKNLKKTISTVHNEAIRNGLISKTFKSLLLFTIIFIIFDCIIMIFSFIYIFCFCAVYRFCTEDWLFSSFLIFCFVQIMPLVSSIGIALFRYFGVKCRIEACFKINEWIVDQS